MNPSRRVSLAILGGLVLLMLSSRCQPIEHFLEIPDASWAIFFIGGFYLSSLTRWAFPLLMLEAVLIDLAATRFMGVSAFCITPAYAFLIPTHAVMWYGGSWLQRRVDEDLRGIVLLAASALVSTTLAYAISNGGFYWFGGPVAEPSLAQYVDQFFTYCRWFVLVPCAYLAAAAVVHVGVTHGLRARTGQASRRG